MLEERVATLQRQVDGLVARRDAQEAEIGRLKASLAARFGAGSGEREAREEVRGRQRGREVACGHGRWEWE